MKELQRTMRWLVILLLLLLAGCELTNNRQDRAPGQEAVPRVTASKAVVPYPPEIERTFLRACIAGGMGAEPETAVARQRCRCTLDRIEAHWDLASFTRVDTEVAVGGALPPEMQDFADACASG